jgi:hypothetical protein
MKTSAHQRFSLRIMMLLGLVLIGVDVARAQDVELVGGGTPGWSFTPGLSFGAVFDSNVGLAAVSPAGQTQSDQLLLAQPFAQLDFLSKRTELSAGYQGYLRRYMSLGQLNGFDQHGHATLRRLISKRTTLAFSDNYARVPTTDELELNGVPFSRTGARRNALAGSLDTRLSKFTTLSLKYDNTWVKFDRSDTLLTGGVVHGFAGNLNRQLSARASAGAEYSIRLADLNEGTRQLTFHDAGGTAQVALSGSTRASFGAGFSFLDDRSLQETRTGPYVRADITHGTEHATVGAGFERMFVPSFGFGGSSQSQQLRAFIQMPLNRNRMYVQGSASWRRTDPFVANELRLDTTMLRSTVGYSATRFLRVEGFYVFTRQDTRIAGGKVNRQRAGAQVVISQPMRIQ